MPDGCQAASNTLNVIFMSETAENKRKRLKFRSWHRGTREMDLLMGSFADRHLPEFSEEQLAMYDDILEYSDPDLYNWMTEREQPPANLVNEVLSKLIAHRIVEN